MSTATTHQSDVTTAQTPPPPPGDAAAPADAVRRQKALTALLWSVLVVAMVGIVGAGVAERFRHPARVDLPVIFDAPSFALVDQEKAFSSVPCYGPPQPEEIYEARGIDREHGAIVLVRPDQYVAHVLPLTAHDELAAFLGRSMLEQAPA